MKKICTLALAFTLLLPLNILAEKNENTVLADRFMEVLKLREQNDQMIEMLQNQINRQILEIEKSYNLNEEKKERLDTYMNQMLGILFDEINWNKLKPERIKIINSIYSEKELKALIFFFESDLGRLFVTKQQETLKELGIVAQKSTQRVMVRMQELQKKMQKELEE